MTVLYLLSGVQVDQKTFNQKQISLLRQSLWNHYQSVDMYNQLFNITEIFPTLTLSDETFLTNVVENEENVTEQSLVNSDEKDVEENNNEFLLRQEENRKKITELIDTDYSSDELIEELKITKKNRSIKMKIK